MSQSIYDASAPVFIKMLSSMRNWLDKVEAGHSPETLVEARIADDMKPLSAQYQFASDSAKNAIARLAGIEAPVMADTETTLAELQSRCDKTIAFIQSVDPVALQGSEEREVAIKFPSGMGYRFTGEDYLRDFALPNFYFHASMAYAILRGRGVPLGKPDYLAHLGMPVEL